MKAVDFIGENAIHKDYGLVHVDNVLKGSRSMVNVTVKQRGRGWNEEVQRYEKYFVGSKLLENGDRSLRWRYTNNDEFGLKDSVNINSLEIKF